MSGKEKERFPKVSVQVFKAYLKLLRLHFGRVGFVVIPVLFSVKLLIHYGVASPDCIELRLDAKLSACMD